MPAPELFPIAELQDISSRVLREDGRAALQYSTTEGYTPLREIIAKQRMVTANINATIDNIMITSGSLRLNFSTMDEEKIVKGIKTLGDVLKKHY